jgi:hypothetical protein
MDQLGCRDALYACVVCLNVSDQRRVQFLTWLGTYSMDLRSRQRW